MKSGWVVAGMLACLALSVGVAAGATQAPGKKETAKSRVEVRDISAVLADILASQDLPGMVGAIVVGDEVVAIGAAGVRKRGAEEKVTVDDRFHIGSCTKSMTATLVATFVEEEKISWNTAVGKVFADLGEKMHPDWNKVTLEQLLTHRGGAPANLDADGLWEALWAHTGTPTEQRRSLVEGVLRHPPEPPPGTKFVYSNAGFAIAGAMLEKLTGKAWENLMRERLFTPLGMSSAGFGAPGSPKSLDQPRGHDVNGSPLEPVPGGDNPAAIGPAGTVHCTVGDWAKYIALHLRGESGGSKLLKDESFVNLHTPAAGPAPEYAMGWRVTERDWAGGRVLTHNGSNTMWFSVTWLAPDKGLAVLVCTNQGGSAAESACDKASWALIQDHMTREALEAAERRK